MTIIILKSIVIWLVFILAESLNGAARIFWLVPLLDDSLAHQVSFATGSVLVLTIATLFIRWLHTSHVSQLLGVGILWFLLTVVYEICLGLFILGYSWQQIGADYNLVQGGLMPIGLVWLMLSPFVAAKNRRVSLHVSD